MAKKSKTKKIEFEIKFYEGILIKSPNFIEALAAIGDLYTKKGDYEKGLVIDQKLARLRPEDPMILYNLACSYSLLNHIDTALTTIKRAIQCGYRDFQYIQQDDDLNNLFKDDRFLQYWKEVKDTKKVNS